MDASSAGDEVRTVADPATQPEVDDGRFITVHGARQNNLKGIDVQLPKGGLTVVTGVSGSGKSSLAFETLYAEGQRRYVESFSTYARQFLERMDRPAVDRIDGLIPAVAIEQRNTIRSARSTLATLTELTDYLKLLFAHRAVLHCRVCQGLVRHDLPGPSIDALLAAHPDARAVITFPFHVGSGDAATLAWSYLGGEGYHRVFVEGQTLDVIDGEHTETVAVVADRAVLRASEQQRLVESLEAAYRMGQGRATVHVEGVEPVVLSIDSDHCGVPHPQPRAGLFSFSSPLGACPTCNGFGRVVDIDLDRVIPDRRKSLAQGAIRPWTGPKRSPERRWLRTMAAEQGLDMDTPWRDLSEAHQRLVLEGSTGAGRQRLRGVEGWFAWLKRKQYKMHVRVLLARYRAYLPCDDCDATRFQSDSLLFRVAGLTIAEVLSRSVVEVRAWLETVSPPEAADDRALRSVLDQLHHRLSYLERVGLGYLTLNRTGRTLSGGEVQRANLTSALGSGLVNTLFVLDEPTIGLHPRDTERLADLLGELTERDNTVVVVEHDPDMLRVADHVIDLGPGPGSHGGEVVYEGPPAGLGDAPESATARALAARAHPRRASSVSYTDRPALVIRGPRAFNLKGDDVSIPMGRMTVLTGVSGSGKSTLLEAVLHRGIRRHRGEVTDAPGPHDGIDGLEGINEVHWIDQSSPAANPRANPATYVKAWDGIRALFAKQPLARRRGYTSGTFSFNAGTGRCPACEGAGYERIEMQFLSDVLLVCSLCEGARFVPEVLEVTWDDRSIADMLQLTVHEALEVLPGRSAAHKHLGALRRVGLGYLTLGQSLATLSGGEAQRLKIAQHLGSTRTHEALFLLDEPTTGLHLADVDGLIVNLEELAAAGNTVVVVEHHLDVIAAADHIIELGPEGGDAGGHLIFEGSPAALAQMDTPTGGHLGRWLAGVDPLDAPRVARGPREGLSEAGRPAAADSIEIVGARVHNLKDVSVTLPRTGRTVVSGVSGSGKSTLAFDLIFAEGQRRFLDCVSPYARQYITQLGRPDATRIAGIPPTVAIEQRTTRGGARSVVANATEISSFLRLLFARLGSDAAASSQRRTPEELAAWLQESLGEREVGICAPAISARKGFHKPVFRRAATMGHTEILVDGVLMPPAPTPRLRRSRLHSIDLVLGRTMTDDPERSEDMIERAASLGGGRIRLLLGQGSVPEVLGPYDVVPAGSHIRRQQFDPRCFSPHTKLGQCGTCSGAGVLEEELEPTTKGGDVVRRMGRCLTCDGERLGPIGRRVLFAGKRLPEFLAMTPPELIAILSSLALDARGQLVAEGPVRAIIERARFLIDVGLDYLTLDRSVRSLSGGEAQRIRLAAQLGAHLSGVLYVLDEPTIGLHPTDTDVLLGALDRLQRRGNGVLMVEHDEATLRTAEVLVDMGPGAGAEGGEILVAGPLEDALNHPRSVTGACLARPRPPVNAEPRPLDDVPFITLTGVRHRNLDGVDVRFPRGRLSVVTGVSGSGKSSLVHDVLAKAIEPVRGEGTWDTAEGLDGLERVIRVDDQPIGKNPRSIPATYIGVWSVIRNLFARLPNARLRGFTASRFSFNVKGGRCEGCAGQGQVKLEMSFLPDAYTPCDTCSGRRFNAQTLQVTYDGHSIHDVLQMPVRDALVLFERVPKLQRALQLLDDVGLGYLQLGQPSTTLSGGEAQRIKLVSHLLGRKRPDTVVVLDEPSIGLHMADVPKLLAVIHRLVEAGTTVVVIEHNVDLVREADWVIDLGPGGGPDGGKVLYQGSFKGLAAVPESRTGAWLASRPG
jgi:excinuclease ABC subunit A